MWRLVSVDHVQCAETSGYEHFLAPPEWTQDEIDAKVDKITDEMIRDAKEVQAAVENPGYGPNFGDYPDLTVKQIKEDFAKKREAYKTWKAANDHLMRSFAKRMEDSGFSQLWDAEDKEETGTIRSSANWGHSHGLKLNYKHWEPIG